MVGRRSFPFWGKRPICRGELVSFRQGSAKWGKTHPQSRCSVVGWIRGFFDPKCYTHVSSWGNLMGLLGWNKLLTTRGSRPSCGWDSPCSLNGSNSSMTIQLNGLFFLMGVSFFFFGCNRCVCVVRFFLVYFPKRICCGVVGLSFVFFFSKQQILRREHLHAEKKLPKEKVFSPKVRFQYSRKYDLKDLISVSLKLFLPPWSLEFFSNLVWSENIGSNMKRVQICPTKIQRPW